MKTEHKYWTIEELRKNYVNIEFPEFQREATVWDLEKKQKLIDSILRDFDISSLYFSKKENDGYDCIDGRQRINAILSFLGINDKDDEDNEFHLKIYNEIYDDQGYFNNVNNKRFKKFPNEWKERFLKYRLNIVEIKEAQLDEELNLLFLRLQIASVLNAGEKLHAMTGDMRDWIFINLVNNEFFNKIKIVNRRYAKEQVAAQIALNIFSKRYDGVFQRSRYIDLQDFFKKYSKFSQQDKSTTKDIENTFDKIVEYFNDKLAHINNRAFAVSLHLFIDELLSLGKENDINKFVEFFFKFLKTLRWQISKGVKMDTAYYDLLNFQTKISQAAGEKTAIEKRHDFIKEYFYYYKNEGVIKGDKEYKKNSNKEPDTERKAIKLK